MKAEPSREVAAVPMRTVGPVRMVGPVLQEEVLLPLATFETPLWHSVARGARVANRAGGVRAIVVDERMSRSILLEAGNAVEALAAWEWVRAHRADLEREAAATSRFARLIDLHAQIAANLLFLRFDLQTGDAAGHNMVTAAADRLVDWILREQPGLRYVSVSGNVCADKKVSAVNGLLGRGRYTVAEVLIPEALCRSGLKTEPQRVVDLNIRKNLLGSILAGGVRSANAHFANMLLAFYLATGQDAANIVEGSQGFTTAEMRGPDLYFAVTLPNLILGTVGHGKDLSFARTNLERLGCHAQRPPGENARRLAAICAAAVLCGELSLLAALTNPGELMRAHLRLERNA